MRYFALLLPGLLVATLAVSRENPPASQVIAFTNATIYTATAEQPIPKGTMLIEGGKIVAVGAEVTIPAGAKTIDLNGQTIIPGLVDTHSHIGIFPKPAVGAHADGNESSGPVQTSLRALDAIDPADPGIRMATAGGITVANIMPGSANVIGGQTLYVKLRGNTVEAMRIFGELDGKPHLGGLKMANGENPKGYGKRGQAPFTRMKVYSLQREQFVKAAEYKKKLDAPRKEDTPAPERDPSLDPLVEVLERKRTVHFHCHRADDLISAIRIAEEFGFELVLQHASEGYRIAEVLAKKKIPCSLTLVDSPGGKAEIMGLLEENAAVLDKAGVMVAVNTDDSVTESRFFLRTGAIALRGGMSEAAALRSLTIHPAKMMHLDHRLGSLEKGKDADFVVLSGKPFSVYTRVQQTWIDGVKVFNASEEADRVYRDGGMFLPRGVKVPEVSQVAQLLSKSDDVVSVGEIWTNKKEIWIYANRIHTGAGKIIENSRIVIKDGKVSAIEKHDPNIDPKLAPLRDSPIAVLHANDVSPGLIDAMTCAGLSGAWNIPADQDQDEGGDANQADLRTLDAFNTNEPLLEFLRSNGITVVHATPGRQTPIAGRSGVFRTGGRTVDDATLVPTFALLVNLGESAKGRGTNTRMGLANQVRKAFADVQGKKGSGAKHEAITAALDGKLKVIFAANRADDIRTALRIAEEFKLKPILALGTESWMMADELAKANIPVIVHPAMQRPGGSMETVNTLLGTAAILNKAGVSITMGSSFEGYVPKNRNLRGEAAIAAVNGLGHANAMKMVTLNAAKLLGIDKTHGSIEVGKVADLVLYDGDPFEHATHVTHTFMAGKLVYDRAEYLKLPFERRILPLVSGNAGCCMFGW